MKHQNFLVIPPELIRCFYLDGCEQKGSCRWTKAQTQGIILGQQKKEDMSEVRLINLKFHMVSYFC